MKTHAEWADMAIADREKLLARHAPTTPKTYDELLERCELLLEGYNEWMTPQVSGFVESISRARRYRDGGK